jgi:anti-sigma regulatory factor (Ser/Thr protein kinase)
VHHEEVLYENSFPVEGGNFDNAGYVSSQIKALLKNLNLSKEVVRRAALVTYESEINIVSYANHGRIVLKVLPGEVVIESHRRRPGDCGYRTGHAAGIFDGNG